MRSLYLYIGMVHVKMQKRENITEHENDFYTDMANKYGVSRELVKQVYFFYMYSTMPYGLGHAEMLNIIENNIKLSPDALRCRAFKAGEEGITEFDEYTKLAVENNEEAYTNGILMFLADHE